MSGRIQVVVGRGAGGWGRRVVRWLGAAGGGEGWVVGVGRERRWRGSLPVAREEALRGADRLVVVCRRGREGSEWIGGELDAFREICPGTGRLLAVVVGGVANEEGSELQGVVGRLARRGRATLERVEVPTGLAAWERGQVARSRARLVSWLTGEGEVDLLAGEWQQAYVGARRRWRVAGLAALGLAACAAGAAVLLADARREIGEREGEVAEARSDEERAQELAQELGGELRGLEGQLTGERERIRQLAQGREQLERSQLVAAVDETWGKFRAGRADGALALLALAEGIERLGAAGEGGQVARWRGRMAALLWERPEWQRVRLAAGPYGLGEVGGDGPVVERGGVLVRLADEGTWLMAWDWRAAKPVAQAMDLGGRAEGLWVAGDGSWAVVEREGGLVQLWGLGGSGKRGEWEGARFGATSADGGVVRLDLAAGGQLLVDTASGSEMGAVAVDGAPFVREVEGGELEVWDFSGRELLAGPLTRGAGTEIEAMVAMGGRRLLVVERPGQDEEDGLTGRGRGGGAGGRRDGLVVRLWEIGGRGDLLGAWDDVGLVALDEEGRRLAYYDGRRELRLLDLGTGRELARVDWSAGLAGGERGEVSLAYGGRGRYLVWQEQVGLGFRPVRALVLAGLEEQAEGSEEGLVAGTELELPEHRPGRDGAGQARWGWSISESGGLLVAADAPDVVQVWSLREGRPIAPPGFPALVAPGEVAAVDLDERAMRLGAITVDGAWVVWDVATGRPLGAGELGGELGGRVAGGLRLLGGGELVEVRMVRGEEGGEALLLDAIGGLASRELRVGAGEVELVGRPEEGLEMAATAGLALDQEAGRAVIFGGEGRVRVIELGAGEAVQEVAGGAEGQHIVVAAGGGWIASVRPGVEPERELVDEEGAEGEPGEEGGGVVVRVASSVLMLRTGGRLSDAKMFNPRGPLGGVGLSADGGVLAVGQVDGGGIDVWRVDDRELVAGGLDAGWGRVERVAVSACGTWLAAAGGEQEGGGRWGLALWRLEDGGEPVWLERGAVKGEELKGFWVVGEGRVVLAYGGRAEVWGRDGGGVTGVIGQIEAAEGGRLEVVPGSDACVVEIRKLPSAAVAGGEGATSASEGEAAGSAGWELVLWRWDGDGLVMAGDAIWSGAEPAAWACSPDGQHLVLGDATGGIGIWETASGLPVVERAGWGTGLVDVRIMDGGAGVVAALEDGRVVRWRPPAFEGAPGVALLADWARLVTGRTLRAELEGGVVVGRGLNPGEVEAIWVRMPGVEGEGS